MIASWQESNDKSSQCVEKQWHYSTDQGSYSQSYGLPSGHIWLWELDHKEGRMPKIDAFELQCCRRLLRVPESPGVLRVLDSKEIKPVNLKGNQHWVLFGRTEAEAGTPVCWSSAANSWLIGKVPDPGKDWGQKEKRASEDEITGWHHWYNGDELGKTPGDSKRQEGLAYCSPWGHKRVRYDWVTEQPIVDL